VSFLPEFCDTCGSFMRIEKEDKDKKVYICPVCGARKVVPIGSKNNPKTIEASIIIEAPKASFEVIDESKFKYRGVLVDKICPKCGHTKAYVEIVQTRAADEPPTRIYHCAKCNFTWREYS